MTVTVSIFRHSPPALDLGRSFIAERL